MPSSQRPCALLRATAGSLVGVRDRCTRRAKGIYQISESLLRTIESAGVDVPAVARTVRSITVRAWKPPQLTPRRADDPNWRRTADAAARTLELARQTV